MFCHTNLMKHHFETQAGVMVCSHHYMLPEHERQIVQNELAEMLKLGIVEESHSAWCSPIVRSMWFCVKYCKMNEVPPFDAYTNDPGRRAPVYIIDCPIVYIS